MFFTQNRLAAGRVAGGLQLNDSYSRLGSQPRFASSLRGDGKLPTPSLSDEEYKEVFLEILVVLAELLAEAPDAGESLRGRTFARVLH